MKIRINTKERSDLNKTLNAKKFLDANQSAVLMKIVEVLMDRMAKVSCLRQKFVKKCFLSDMIFLCPLVSLKWLFLAAVSKNLLARGIIMYGRSRNIIQTIVPCVK